MFSRNVIKKMALELSVPTMVSMAREALDTIGEKVNDAALDAVANVELITAEIKRRGPPPTNQPQPQPSEPRSRRRNEKAPEPETGGEPNV